MLYQTTIKWLRLGRRKTYLWSTVAVMASNYLFNFGIKQKKAKINLFARLWQLNAPKIIEVLSDLLW